MRWRVRTSDIEKTHCKRCTFEQTLNFHERDYGNHTEYWVIVSVNLNSLCLIYNLGNSTVGCFVVLAEKIAYLWQEIDRISLPSLSLVTHAIWNHLQHWSMSCCSIYYRCFVGLSTFVMEIIPNLSMLSPKFEKLKTMALVLHFESSCSETRCLFQNLLERYWKRRPGMCFLCFWHCRLWGIIF